MKETNLSRRQFTRMAGGVPVASVAMRGATPVTAESVVVRLQSALGGAWPSTGVDGVKAGDPRTPVRGIVTTAMATMDVLKRAVETRANFIVSYEPTFFGRQDGPASAPAPAGSGGPAPRRLPQGISQDDPVYRAKKQFIENNGLVVFRLHDHWRSRAQGEMTAGLADALGWTRYRVKNGDGLYEIPPASAEDVVSLVRGRLNLQGGLRAVGDRKARVRRVMLYPGFLTAATMWQRYSEADLILTGEVREWENTFFAADLLTAGEKRGLVTVGRIASEDPGMRVCAGWLKTIVKEVPVRWIPAGDLYWRAV